MPDYLDTDLIMPPLFAELVEEFGDPTDGELVMPIPSFADWPMPKTEPAE